MEARQGRTVKAAIIGGNGREYEDRDICIIAWPAPPAHNWDAWRAEIVKNNFDFIIFTPPGSFQLSLNQLKSFILSQQIPLTEESALLPRLQDEFETRLQTAGNFAVIIFTPEELNALTDANPARWSELTAMARGIKPAATLNAGISFWHAARLRGALMRQRLLGFKRQSGAQLKLEINYLIQLIIILVSFTLFTVHLLGPNNLLWLAVLLIYPLNRPFIRYVAEQAPEKITACLGYCLLRPLGWLTGMLCPPKTGL